MSDKPQEIRHDAGDWISGPMMDPAAVEIPDTLTSVIADLSAIVADLPIPADRLDVVVRMLRELAGELEEVASLLRGES